MWSALPSLRCRHPSPPPDDPLTLAIVETCEKLQSLIVERRDKEGDAAVKDSSDAVPQDTKDLLVAWLTKAQVGSQTCSLLWMGVVRF